MPELASNPLIAGMSEIRRSWGWLLAFGISLMLLGVVSILGDVTATFATVRFFGWMLLFSGVLALIHALRTRTWRGFFLQLLTRLSDVRQTSTRTLLESLTDAR